MPTAVSCTVRGQAAVPASVCDLGSRDLEETAMRQNLVMPVRHQQLSILQPFNLRYRITWEIVKGGLRKLLQSIEIVLTGTYSKSKHFITRLSQIPDASQVRVMLCFSFTLVSTIVPSSTMLGGTVGKIS